MNDLESANLFPSGSGNERYQNPFWSIPLKFFPVNMDAQLWWANHFFLRFSWYRTALTRIANYFITSLEIQCESSDGKENYKEVFDQIKWKPLLSSCGLNYLGYGNLFLSVNQGFQRFLICPKCSKYTNIDRVWDYKFSKQGEYLWKCEKCHYAGKFESHDKPSTDVDNLSTVIWNPREVITRFDETSNEQEYFWRIPGSYKAKVLKENNKFYSKVTAKVIYDCLTDKGGEKLFAFNKNNFIHLKANTPAGLKTDGKAIPFCIYMFDDFFMLKVLERFDEAICFEDIIPFRVFSPSAENNGQVNPLLSQNSAVWTAAVKRMVDEHRRDPGSYHTFPFPVKYDQLGAEGKNITPADRIAQARANILNAFNIPQELFTMNLQWQSIGPALRLFENSWSSMIAMYNEVLQHMADVIGKIKGFPEAKVTLIPTTLSDDMEKKSIISQLVSANAIAKSELLSIYNLDFEDQLRKKMQEDRTTKKLQDEEQVKQQLEQAAQSGTQSQGGTTPTDVMQQAQELAQQLFPMDGAARREKLQEIKGSDAGLYSQVKQQLQELTSQSRSQGTAQAKQQAAQQ